MKRAFLIFIFLFLWAVSFATDHYAITGTTWGAGGTTWAATSGGSATLGDPTSSDAVIFDASSPNVTCSGSPVGLSLTTTGYTGTISGAGISLYIYGNITLSATTVISTTSFGIRASGTFTANGATISSSAVYFNGTGATIDLGGDITVAGELSFGGGTINTNNYNISAGHFTSTFTVVRVVNLGSSILTLTGTSGVTLSGSNLTFNAGTSTIKFTNTSATGITFAGGGYTFYDVWFDRGASTGTITVTGTNTFNSFRYNNGSAARTIIFPNVTTTIAAGGLLLGGSSGNLLTLARTGGSGTMTISVASGTICLDYLSISNSAATGGATFYAGAGSTDGGGNTGWTFTACPSANTSNFFFKP